LSAKPTEEQDQTRTRVRERNNRKVSVVIPSNRQQVLTLNSSEGIPGVEILIERVPNVSRARNLGVVKARGEIVAILDDDIEFSKEWFLNHCKSVRRGVAFWADPPCIIFVTKYDFLKAGGFDEALNSGEVQEFALALKKAGVTLSYIKEGFKHLVPSRRQRTHATTWKLNALFYLRHTPVREWWKIIRRQRNPVKLVEIGLWVAWWKLRGLQKKKGLKH